MNSEPVPARVNGSVGPCLRLAVPAMILQFSKKLGIEGSSIAQRKVLAHVIGISHAHNGRTYLRTGEYEAQSGFGQTGRLRQSTLQLLDMTNGLRKVFRAEVLRSPVALRKPGV